MTQQINENLIGRTSLLALLKIVSFPGIVYRGLALFIAVFLLSESVAATPVQLQLQFSPLGKQEGWGGASSIAQQPAATDQEATRATAERAYREAEQLQKQGTAESLRQAITKLEQALPLYRAVGDRCSEASTLLSIGQVYSDLGEKQKALDYYNLLLPMWSQLGDQKWEAATLNNIGYVYSDLGEKQEALDYYNLSLPLARQVGDKVIEAVTLNNIGSIYSDLGEKQKALSYYNQSLPLARQVGNKTTEAITLFNIGEVYFDLGEKQKALNYFIQSLPLWHQLGDEKWLEVGVLFAIIQSINLQQLLLGLSPALFLALLALKLRTDQLHKTNPAQGYDALAPNPSEGARVRNHLERQPSKRR